MQKTCLILMILLLPAAEYLFSEGLFDSAVTESTGTGEKQGSQSKNSSETNGKSESADTGSQGFPAGFSGSVKGLFSSGINRSENNLDTEDSFTEFRGKITASPSEKIKAFTEIVAVNVPADEKSDFEVREAYIDIYGDLVDFSIGEKIVVWGKADAVNPTNRITPVKNSFISSSEDDRRLGNLLAEIRFNLYPFTFTGIWLPVYKQSQLPSFMESELVEPDNSIDNSSFALKTDFESSSFDFSLSYFNGYNPEPGISGIETGKIKLKPYRIHNIGFDFSTTLSDYGIRGETAFLVPFENHEEIYVPSPEISYVAGIDRSIGDFTLILQYSGKYITDFIDQDNLGGLTLQEIRAENLTRIISRQTDRICHSAVFRASVDLFYETLSIETAGNYNFTTKELFIKPLIIWDASDSLSVSGGAFIYSGPDETMFGMLKEQAGSIFTEVKLSF